MLLERTTTATTTTAVRRGQSDDDDPSAPQHQQSGTSSNPEPPLVCMIYFFAAQMSRNIQTTSPADRASGPTSEPGLPAPHRLDQLLSKIGMHAAFSPLITQFETFPVEIPEMTNKKRPKLPRESMHDTMLLVKFRSKRAREEWITTKEWQEFMDRTESEGVFRRLPHVRCAKSVRGLSNPMEVLGV